MQTITADEHAKTLGAYYTDAQIADFLTWWAIRSADDSVLDPCFGGGVFLRSACRRVHHLRGDPARQVFGVEVDPVVHQEIREKLVDEFSIPAANLNCADFFATGESEHRSIDALVGNPPFVRYQRFSGEARRIALSRCRSHGVDLPELCSSWAPFLVCSIAIVSDGGRLAMVVPMEVAHAKYARPVLEFIRRSFATATFVTFRKKLFPDLSEDTLLLLAEGKGMPAGRFRLIDLAHAGRLQSIRASGAFGLSAKQLDTDAISTSRARLIEYFIPKRAMELYRQLRQSPAVARLSDLATVGIGYVTGANDYFHLSEVEVRRLQIPKSFVKRAVRRGRSLSGLRFTPDDWERAAANDDAGYLLHIQPGKRLPEPVRRYISDGEARGIAQAYKCRTRSPWYCVPHVKRPDAFLSYMSGATPRLVANEACAFAPNSLHLLNLRPLASVSGRDLSVWWQTSLTKLSVEIEGHALGGGMLKLEPSEAKNVLVACPPRLKGTRDVTLESDLDELVRTRRDDLARRAADARILLDGLGLSKRDCELLHSAASILRSRRGYRG